MNKDLRIPSNRCSLPLDFYFSRQFLQSSSKESASWVTYRFVNQFVHLGKVAKPQKPTPKCVGMASVQTEV